MERDIVASPKRLTINRDSKGFLLRKSEVWLEKTTTGPMKDAMREISSAYAMEAGHMGYATGSLEKTGRRAVENFSEEHEEAMQKDINKMRHWSKNCPTKWRGIVIDVLVFQFSVKDIAFQRAIEKETVKERFIKGLNRYCELQGWS